MAAGQDVVVRDGGLKLDLSSLLGKWTGIREPHDGLDLRDS